MYKKLFSVLFLIFTLNVANAQEAQQPLTSAISEKEYDSEILTYSLHTKKPSFRNAEKIYFVHNSAGTKELFNLVSVAPGTEPLIKQYYKQTQTGWTYYFIGLTTLLGTSLWLSTLDENFINSNPEFLIGVTCTSLIAGTTISFVGIGHLTAAQNNIHQSVAKYNRYLVFKKRF